MKQTENAALLELGLFLKRSGYRFTVVTPATHSLVNSRPGNEWARDLAGIFGWSRPFKASLVPAELMAIMREAGVLIACGQGWRSVLRASSMGAKLLFHSAFPTVETDAVFFGPDTYRFVSALKQHFITHPKPVHRAVDIGCGAGPGAIAVALAQHQADVLAVDINQQALRLTEVNSALAGTSKVQALYSDLLGATDGTFDLIISNPPYLLDPTRRAYRHGGGELGAGLSLAILQSAIDRLSNDGSLLLYTGAVIVEGVDAFRNEAEALLRSAGFGWSYREIDPDVFGEELACPAYAHADRIAAVVLTAHR